jgi:putative ABC transport system permease protein
VPALILAVMVARRGQALVVALLAVFAAAGAVAGPAYQRAAQQSVVEAEVAAAPALERAVQVTAVPESDWSGSTFSDRIMPALALPTFTVVLGAHFDVALAHGNRSAVPRLMHRDDVCSHIRITAGRCATGAREVILGRRTAELLGVDVGTEVRFASVSQTRDGWLAGKRWTPSFVTGIYDPIDPAEPYWAGREFFGGTDRAAPEPAFATQATLDLVENAGISYSADLLSGPTTFAPDRLAGLREDLVAIRSRLPGQATVTTNMSALLDRIEANRTLVGQIVPIAALPLILLCWFVIYLAVAAATEQRRPEFGLLALRGAPRGPTWLLALGPTVVPVLVGAPLGYLLGLVAVNAFANATLPAAVESPLTLDHLPQAGLAVAGALLAGAWGQRQLFRSAVGPLVRRVPPRVHTAGSLTAAAIAVTLAVVAVAQLRTSGGQLVGVAQLGPALVALAVALGVAQLLVPLSRRAGRRALRRGRLGPALAAMRLARRPGAQRLLALTAVAVALLAFASIAVGVAADQRTQRGRVEVGATRIVPVALASATALVDATRKLDPEGRFAMAAVVLPADGVTGSAVLAVDSGRLTTAALWPANAGISAAEAAAMVRPAVSDPVLVDGTGLAIDVTVNRLAGAEPPRLRANLAPVDGRADRRVELGNLVAGRTTYRGTAADCAIGCRLASIELVQAGQVESDVDMVIHGVAQTGPDRAAVDGERLGTWLPSRQSRTEDKLTVGPGSGGASVHAFASSYGTLDGRIRPPDAAYPLPLVAAGAAGPVMRGLDRREEPIVAAGSASVLPRVGNLGRLVDLEFLARIAFEVTSVPLAEVWLGPRAPNDAVDRLRAAGLVPGAERTLAGVLDSFAQQGPAVALRFHLATGGVALMLAVGATLLVAAGDRADRAEELRALRTQGVRRRDSAVAARRGYLWVVVAAVAAGVVGAALAWLAVGQFVPMFADRPLDGALHLPAPLLLLAPAAVSVLVLTVAAVLASRSGRVR